MIDNVFLFKWSLLYRYHNYVPAPCMYNNHQYVLLPQLLLPSFVNTIAPYIYWICLIEYLVSHLINNKVNCFIKLDNND